MLNYNRFVCIFIISTYYDSFPQYWYKIYDSKNKVIYSGYYSDGNACLRKVLKHKKRLQKQPFLCLIIVKVTLMYRGQTRYKSY